MVNEREKRTYVDVGCLCFDDGDFSGLVPCDETSGYGRDEREREDHGVDIRCRMERGPSVPTATEGRRGVKRKKFFGLMTI